MSDKVRIGVAGLGKMGLSHFALINPHPLSETIACDATGYLIDVLGKYIPNPAYKSYDKMLAEADLVPTILSGSSGGAIIGQRYPCGTVVGRYLEMVAGIGGGSVAVGREQALETFSPPRW